MNITSYLKRIFVLPYLMRDASIEFKKDNYHLAINIYSKVINSFPDNYDAYLWSGTAYAAINNDNLAIEYFEKALSINPKGFDAYYYYSKLALKQNRFKNSLELLDKSIEYYPFNSKEHSNLYYEKGMLEYYLRNYIDALKSFNKSIELFPNNENAESGKTLAAESLLWTNEATVNNHVNTGKI
jgi:tetratricopeptide (TPR) repeat protein